MGRPRNEIRAKVRTRDGIQTVLFAECSDHWFVTPEYDRKKAIAWARRNKERLIRSLETDTLAALCKNFYALDGAWVTRQKDKGFKYGNFHLRNRQAYLDNYFCKEFGHYKPSDIDRPDFRREFDDWLLTLKSYKAGNRNASRATKNKIIYSVNGLFEELVELKRLSANPLIGLKKYSKRPEHPRGTIDRKSLERMFPDNHGAMVRIWGSSMWACLMLVFYDTGARPGEVRALTWKDIDSQKRFVPFRKGVEAGTTDTIKSTKTEVVKSGFFTERTIKELDIFRTETKWSGTDDFIFTRNGVKPVTDEGIIKAFRKGLRQIEKDYEGWKANPAWTPYWLRHSFGTYQMENLTQEEIAKLMGNSPAVLQQSYQHADDETLFHSTKGIQEKLDRARKSS